jgi:A/G-specific adenine glycosylase
MTENNFPPLRRALVAWYQKNKRDLPWRKTSDPYAIWISETMLQQTQVKTVLPYYQKFLEAFPTIAALDRAPLSRVLRLWSGLGYYRRAENLKKAARQIMRQHNGSLPRDYERLRALPGIGEYTAGAVLSIAFNRRYPAVDGNVRRVLSRVFNPDDKTEMLENVNELLANSSASRVNQGLMELGATICLPREPICAACPVAKWCTSRTGNGVIKDPFTRKKLVFKNTVWPLAIVRRRGKVLLRRRSITGLLARLWELPGGEKSAGECLVTTLRRHLEPLVIDDREHRCIGEVRHSITNRRIRAPIYLLELDRGLNISLPPSGWRWVSTGELHRYPLSSMTIKACALLTPRDKNSR